MHHTSPYALVPHWENAPAEHLYGVRQLDQTPLGVLPIRTRYALIREGLLEAVAVGRRRYLTKLAVQRFVANAGLSRTLQRGADADCESQAPHGDFQQLPIPGGQDGGTNAR